MIRRLPALAGPIALAALMSLLVGCRAEVSGTPNADDASIAVLDPWVRPSPATTSDAAFYLTLDNRTAVDDHYAGASSPRCDAVVPHLTSFDDDGVASMTALGDALDVPAGEQIRFEPNGLHLMCVGLDDPFDIGETVDVEIRFDEHAPVHVEVVVERR